MKRIVRFSFGTFVLIGLGVLFLFGCAQPPPPTQSSQPAQQATQPSTAPSPAREVVLNVAAQDDLINLDPAKTTQAGDRNLSENIFSGLVKFKPGTADPGPDLAESWTISNDGLVYTFNLRKGVKFHRNYGELTADDVKFSFDRHFDPDVGSAVKSDLDLIAKTEVADPNTVKITLKQPAPSFLVRMAWQSAYVVSQKAIKELGKDFGFKPVGTGPYSFSSWTPGQEIVLVANPNYFGGKPKIDKLVFKVVKDESVAMLAFDKGEIDVVPVKQLGSFRQAAGKKNATVVQGASQCVYFIYMNNTMKPFDDVRVRQALNYAIDKDKLAKTVDNMIKISPSVLSPLFPEYTTDVEAYKYNPDKAKQLLAEAGIPKDFKITVNYTKSYLYEELALSVKDQLSQLGLSVGVVPVERAVVSKIRSEKTYQLLPGTITRFDADQYFSAYYQSGASQNNTGYSSKKVDDLLKSARSELDPAKRKAMYVEVQKQIAADAPNLVVGTFDSIMIARSGVKGLYAHPYEALMDFAYAYVEDSK